MNAIGARELGITRETFARITAPPTPAGDLDEVLGVPSYFSLGFLRPGPTVWFGSSPRAFGSPGAGGSFAFADPDAHLGYAYVMNKLDFYLENDPREKSLRDAVYGAIRRLGLRAPLPQSLPRTERGGEGKRWRGPGPRAARDRLAALPRLPRWGLVLRP
jgi:CubicO group peptidase (beta-lactamase class C family)